MRKAINPNRVFLDTSAVIYYRHGHTLMQAAVREVIGDGVVHVSPFVRMEYLRGVILNLIDLYFLLAESPSVGDALIDWGQKVQQERKLKIVLMTVHHWLVADEDWQSQERSLERLGELIVEFIEDFDEAFPSLPTDPLRCQLGRVALSPNPSEEEMLRQFQHQFRAIQAGIPECRLCRFRQVQQRRLARQKIEVHSAAQRQMFADNLGYVRQAERLEEAATSPEQQPSCRWCERLGDAIIALHAPARAPLLTADRTFLPFGQLLNRDVRLLPSLAELKRRHQPDAL
jgi:predicted nucleic acid-binding protein